MTPRKTNPPNEDNPVLSARIPPEVMRQVDHLCKRYNMNRTQLILMLIAKEYGALDQRKEGGDEC